jgi:hypothetical protein
MEEEIEIPKNHIDAMLNAHDSDELDSQELSDMYMLTFTNQDDNNFKMCAENPECQFLYEIKMSDYVNLKEKDFTSQINNFKLLLQTIEKALEKNKVVLSKLNDDLKLTFHYTNIYDEKKISFELKKELSEEEKEKEKEKERQEREQQILMTKDSGQIEEEEKNKVDYKAEIIEYSKKFEDFGDRNIIKVLIENKGSHYWPKEKASFRCAQEFSSLICKEYFLEENVKPGEQIELALEFLKNQKENLKQPYITSLNLYVHPQKFEPMLVLDFNENYNNENIPFEGPELKKEQQEDDKDEENDIIVINDVNIFDETKGTKGKNEKIEIKKGKTLIKKKIKTKVVETETGPKEMTPFQRRIYELNQKEKERLEREKERQKKTGWKKNF